MNLLGHRPAACVEKAALKPHARQTLRDCHRLRTARSVWSAPDLSALSIDVGRARGSFDNLCPLSHTNAA
jgi:hypothetical protein